MTDYLERQRYIPYGELKGIKIPSKEEIDAKKCDTCIHYDFYFCKAMQVDTAPKRTCKNAELYVSRVDSRNESQATIEE